jgi:hypothetical protein
MAQQQEIQLTLLQPPPPLPPFGQPLQAPIRSYHWTFSFFIFIHFLTIL